MDQNSQKEARLQKKVLPIICCMLLPKQNQEGWTGWQLLTLTGISLKCLGPAPSSASILNKAFWSIPRGLNAASKCENIGSCPIYQNRNNSTHSPLGSIWSTSNLLFVLFILSHLSAIQLSGHTAHTLKPRVQHKDLFYCENILSVKPGMGRRGGWKMLYTSKEWQQYIFLQFCYWWSHSENVGDIKTRRWEQ